ncbi:hypothetical protein TNCV_2852451 [Trichonephila clavipes]|nr:hypothetical protein TNCV_2852451 [Trichonephila clavipes]
MLPLVIVGAIKLDHHVLSNGRSMPYSSSHVQKHRNELEPLHEHHASSFVHYHLPYELWVIQVQFFGYLFCTPNEESGCVDFESYFWDTLYTHIILHIFCENGNENIRSYFSSGDC